MKLSYCQIFLGLFLTPFLELRAQAKPDSVVKYTETVMIRVVENQCHDFKEGMGSLAANSTDSRMIVLGPDGESQVIQLQKVHLANESDESFGNNSRAIKVQIQKWNNQQFQVVSAASTTVRECIMITTIIMGKN